ncbi:MAG: NHL repeat-containing protein, partial [Actinomycetota bacterium]|nr:NHL repeat-containing protein [Actinomycetota bacterium]
WGPGWRANLAPLPISAIPVSAPRLPDVSTEVSDIPSTPSLEVPGHRLPVVRRAVTGAIATLLIALLLALGIHVFGKGGQGQQRQVAVTPAGLASMPAGRTAALAGAATRGGVNLLSPRAVAFDDTGNLYLAEGEADRIRRLTPDGKLSTVYGPLPGSQQLFDHEADPNQGFFEDLAVDHAGNIYVLSGRAGGLIKIASGGGVTTIATGRGGSQADGVPASQAQFKGPAHLAIDTSGNVYFSDTGAHKVRKVSAAGIITTVAGDGDSGVSGDGGPAAKAQLQAPDGLAVDAAGNLYIADPLASRIRIVHPDGTIETFAGTGQPGLRPPSNGTAALATAMSPRALALGPDGSLYVALDRAVLRVTPDRKVRTVAGDGIQESAGDGGPAPTAGVTPDSLAVDTRGGVFVAQRLDNRIREITPDGTIRTVLGDGQARSAGDGGAASAATLDRPSAVAFDGAGNVLVAESSGDRVRKITPAGTITTFAGKGPCHSFPSAGDGSAATGACLAHPDGLAVYGGALFIAEGGLDSRVREVSSEGIITTVAGGGSDPARLGDGGPATAAYLSDVRGLAVDEKGNLYIADHGNGRVRKVGPNGIITTIAGIAVGTDESGDGGPATRASLAMPEALALDGEGNLYILGVTGTVRQIALNGVISTVPGTVRASPPDLSDYGGPARFGLAVGHAGEVYVSVSDDNRVRMYGFLVPSGSSKIVAGSGDDTFGSSSGPPTSVAMPGPNSLSLSADGRVLLVATNIGEVWAVALK